MLVVILVSGIIMSYFKEVSGTIINDSIGNITHFKRINLL